MATADEHSAWGHRADARRMFLDRTGLERPAQSTLYRGRTPRKMSLTHSRSQSHSEIRRDLRERSTSGSFEEINRTMSGRPRDVRQVVRRWGLKFAGDPGKSIDTFLKCVEENWILAKLTEGEILTALPELFVGIAGTWVR